MPETPSPIAAQRRRRLAWIVVLVVACVAVLAWRMRGARSGWVSPEELDATMPAAPPATMPNLAPGSAQPGPAPPGKVWSSEHGHWHDDPGAAAGSSQPLQLTPVQPGSDPAAPMTSGTPVPQPEGPVPPGKVWSPEHGHWHDDPAAAPSGSVQPLQMTPIAPGSDPAAPVSSPTPIPQPEGPVPPGKVWSPEHGHWHDAP